MKAETAKAVAAALFTAAGRRCGEAEDLVWADALAGVPDDGAFDVVQLIIREVDLGAPGRGVPTPALFMTTRRQWVRSLAPVADQRELPAPMPEDGRQHIARLRAELAAHPPIVRPAPASLPEPERPQREPLPVCCEEDHVACAGGPIRDRSR